MKNFLNLIFYFSLAGVLFAGEQAETKVGGYANLREFVDAKLAAGEKNIEIPAGRYFLKPKGGSHLKFDGLEGIAIKADGAEMVCMETNSAIRMGNCKNITIDGLTIDYHPLPYTQGKIVKLDDDKQIHEVEIFEGYPDTTMLEDGNRYEIYDAKTRRLKTNTYGIKSLERLAPNKFRLVKQDWIKNAEKYKNEELGDIVVLSMPSSKHRGGHAVQVLDSENIAFKNIKLYAAPAFGFYDGDCDKIRYENVRIDRRDKDDFIARANPRVRSLNADGFHSGSAKTGPAYINCYTSWNGDDSIAIHGSYYPVFSSEGDTLRVGSRSNKFDFEVGDKLEIYRPDGIVEYANIKEIAKDTPASEEEIAWVEKLKIYPNFKTYKTFYQDAYKVKLDRVVDAPRRTMIMNSGRMGNGFKIIGGYFGNNRSRGLILKTGNGVVDGVTIGGSWMESIKIAPEWFWFEGGHTENLTIKNCKIICGVGPAISINSPTADEKDFSPAGANNNIKIINNKFLYTFNPCIFATSVKKLRLKGNSFEIQAEPFYQYKYDRHMGRICNEPIVLINCE